MKKAIWSLLSFIAVSVQAQVWNISEVQPMPERISNNAVCAATAGAVPCVFSFGGIDSTKLYSGITQKSFRYNTVADEWETIPPLPDTLGKIASSASTVKNKIYIIGGYHVYASGNEKSSNKVHIYDPDLNIWLPDGANVPFAIDDQTQCVWRDSLIYVITGWSNTTNVPHVQIYNPAANTWTSGTPVPNNNTYKAFGSAGTIVGDTIYYYGGASLGSSFPAVKALRKGVIDPANPASITWSNPSMYLNDYRCAAATDSMGNVYFIGGSEVTYNYNGIAYNGSGAVEPHHQIHHFHVCCPATWYSSVDSLLPMDLRSTAEVTPSVKYIAGGMEPGQQVSRKTLKLSWILASSEESAEGLQKRWKLAPVPASDQVNILGNEIPERIDLVSLQGTIVKSWGQVTRLDVSEIPEGIYILCLTGNAAAEWEKIVIQK